MYVFSLTYTAKIHIVFNYNNYCLFFSFCYMLPARNSDQQFRNHSLALSLVRLAPFHQRTQVASSGEQRDWFALATAARVPTTKARQHVLPFFETRFYHVWNVSIDSLSHFEGVKCFNLLLLPLLAGNTFAYNQDSWLFILLLYSQLKFLASNQRFISLNMPNYKIIIIIIIDTNIFTSN